MGKEKVTKEFLKLTKKWTNQLKDLKKAMSNDKDHVDEMARLQLVNLELRNYVRENQEELLKENPKNNQKRIDGMMKDFEKIDRFLAFYDKVEDVK